MFDQSTTITPNKCLSITLRSGKQAYLLRVPFGMCLERDERVDPLMMLFVPVTGIIVVCIVCVGFVSLLIVLGVMRIRNTKRHSQRDNVNVDEKQEMEWDNSALTITVNPMDQQEVCILRISAH